jgi:hypothetical protein
MIRLTFEWNIVGDRINAHIFILRVAVYPCRVARIPVGSHIP